jgi:hypothetical protein
MDHPGEIEIFWTEILLMGSAEVHKTVDKIECVLVIFSEWVHHVRDYIPSQEGIQGIEMLTNVIRSSGKTSIFLNIILVRIIFYDYDCRYLPVSIFTRLDSSQRNNNSRITEHNCLQNSTIL